MRSCASGESENTDFRKAFSDLNRAVIYISATTSSHLLQRIVEYAFSLSCRKNATCKLHGSASLLVNPDTTTIAPTASQKVLGDWSGFLRA